MYPFEEYLKQQNLEALTVAMKAQVRYMVVYNAVKGNPITTQHAQQIRQAVLNITGVPFTGTFLLTQSLLIDELPTLPIRTRSTQRVQ